jgi:glutamate synthase domain-containing protein 3
VNNTNKPSISNLDHATIKQAVKIDDDVIKIDATDLHYRELNSLLKTFNNNGTKRINVNNVYGQRYIGTNLNSSVEVNVYGTPGNDLGAFMRGLTINVYGNAQDGCGNTMDDGRIIVHGYAGDIVGNSMRGGKIFVRDDAGYRVGIHMKEYEDKKPAIVIGGSAQDFLGEYMAGGILVVLGLTSNNNLTQKARFIGTGMHGGRIYLRGKVENVVSHVKVTDLDETDEELLRIVVGEFCEYFDFNLNEIMKCKFAKITPLSNRPYEELYSK